MHEASERYGHWILSMANEIGKLKWQRNGNINWLAFILYLNANFDYFFVNSLTDK